MPRLPLVLIAEGHDDTRALWITLFRLHGFDVVDSATGAAALGLACALEPDVVVLDWRLCEPGHPSLSRQLRVAARGPLIVAIADPGRSEGKARAMADGCDVYIEKPVDVLRLVQLVQSCAGAGRRVAVGRRGLVH